jgi:hypothetical protein
MFETILILPIISGKRNLEEGLIKEHSPFTKKTRNKKDRKKWKQYTFKYMG